MHRREGLQTEVDHGGQLPLLQRAGIKHLLIANLQRNVDNLSTHFG
jgi:hypothetical protein